MERKRFFSSCEFEAVPFAGVRDVRVGWEEKGAESVRVGEVVVRRVGAGVGVEGWPEVDGLNG